MRQQFTGRMTGGCSKEEKISFSILAAKAISGVVVAGALAGGGTAAQAVNETYSTVGYKISNDSSAMLVLDKVSGEVAAPGPIGSVLLPGQMFDAEVKDDFLGENVGDIYYDAYDPGSGSSLGALVIHLTASGEGSMTLNDIQQGGQGSRFTSNQYDRSGDAFYTNSTNNLLDRGSAVWEVDNDTYFQGTTAGAVLQSVCNAPRAVCAYGASSVTEGYGPSSVIASEYGGDPTAEIPSGTETGTISTQTGWSTSQTNSYSSTVSAGVNLFDVLSAGVSATSGSSFTSENNFATDSQGYVYAGETTEILASAPVYNATGDLTVKLGNASWTFNDADFSYPRIGAAVQYQLQRVDGDVNPPIDGGVNGPPAHPGVGLYPPTTPPTPGPSASPSPTAGPTPNPAAPVPATNVPTPKLPIVSG
jgi:hypothetical protein